jgi:hypothetical protein
MKKIILRILAGFAGIVLVAQLFQPSHSNPSSDSTLSLKNYKGIPPEVLSKFESSCFDCHSNDTRWPWYSYLTPVNYLVARDVSEGRRHLNFSEWASLKPGKMMSRLEDIYNEVYHRKMPLPIYVPMHPESKLSDADIKLICDWASGEQDHLDQVREMQNQIIQNKGAGDDSTRTQETH